MHLDQGGGGEGEHSGTGAGVGPAEHPRVACRTLTLPHPTAPAARWCIHGAAKQRGEHVAGHIHG